MTTSNRTEVDIEAGTVTGIGTAHNVGVTGMRMSMKVDLKIRGIITITIRRFLLAQLYLSLLSDKLTLHDIRSAMETFRKQGQGLGEDQKDQVLTRAYEQAMERINGQMPGMKTLAMKVLSWTNLCTA